MFKLLSIVIAFTCAPLMAQNLDVITPKKTTTLPLLDMKAKLKTYTVKIDDPVYKAIKEYDAFALSDVLQMAGAEPSDNADEIIFGTVDGYAPNLEFSVLKDHRALVAYQEHATPGRFALVAQGKAKVSPWPFYLVWEDGVKAGPAVPWPYQMIKIEVVDWKQKFPLVAPVGAKPGSPEMKGFAIFKAECIRCHSVNLQGGDVGPELNAPQNVTEYWKNDVLREFIHDTSTFRYKSKMPAFTKLSSKDLDALVAYLKHMKEHKIKSPKA
ncbi:MAG: c-type cytochrome [Bdellovibrionales bacterium]